MQKLCGSLDAGVAVFLGDLACRAWARAGPPPTVAGPAGLHRGLLKLLKKGDGKCASIRRHSFCWFGAAQRRRLGLAVPGVMLYGDRRSRKVAEMYC